MYLFLDVLTVVAFLPAFSMEAEPRHVITEGHDAPKSNAHIKIIKLLLRSLLPTSNIYNGLLFLENPNRYICIICFGHCGASNSRDKKRTTLDKLYLLSRQLYHIVPYDLDLSTIMKSFIIASVALLMALCQSTTTTAVPAFAPTIISTTTSSTTTSSTTSLHVFRKIKQKIKNKIGINSNKPKARGAGFGPPLADISQAVGNTPLIQINDKLCPDGRTIYAKAEYFNPLSSVKDRLALSIIETAEKEGKLKPGDTVIEATSGNTGIAVGKLNVECVG